MFIGFSILFFIGVNAENFLLYTLFSKSLVSEINAGDLDMLAKIKNATELMYKEMISLSTQLGHDNITITKIMFENERDRLLEYQGHQILQNALVSFPYVDYFAVYNERLDELIGTVYFTAESEAELKKLARNYYQQRPYSLTIPLVVENQANLRDARVLNTITLLIYSPLSLENDKGVLLVGITCDYFQQLISKMDEGNMDTVMILHGNGQVISHPDISQVLTDYSGNEFVKEMNRGNDSGFFIRDIDAVETFVSYTRSSILDWVFINMVPYKKITARLLFLRNFTFVITLVILCAGIITSYLLAVKMYNPIRQILNRLNYDPPRKRNDPRGNENLYIEKQLEYLSSAAHLSESMIRSTVVFDLLRNQYIDNDIINSHAIEAAFKEPYYMACVFSYDNQEGFGKMDAAAQGDMRNRLIKIAEELFKKACTAADYAAISSTDIALLLHLDAGAVPENLGLLMAETGEMVKKFNGLSVSAAAGPVVNSIFAINDSFEEAREILKERFFLESETYLLRRSGAARGETQFPEQVMEELNNGVIAREAGEITASMGRLSAELEKASYEHARMHLNTAVMRLLSFCLVNKLPVDANSFHALNGEMQNADTLRSACGIFLGFCLSLVKDIHKDSEEGLPPIVRDAVKLAEEKYMDPVFSINTAAAFFNITPAYFNRVFKKHKHTSYSEFLNGYRMEKARAMLLETNESVNAIANSVGINNATYFYTLFKKIYNCTPQQFRNTRK